MSSSYRISDEPTPSQLAKFAVNPLWPFLAVMLGGVWLSWSWFAFNAMAVGSPTVRREIIWIIAGLTVSVLLVMVIFYLEAIGILNSPAKVQYALLVLTAWQLGVTYALYTLQSRTIQIYEYFGGTLRNGLIVVIVAMVFRKSILAIIAPTTFLKLVIG